MKQPALAGDIVLLFADESEALTHPDLARAGAKRGADLRVPAPAQSQKIAMMEARLRLPPAHHRDFAEQTAGLGGRVPRVAGNSLQDAANSLLCLMNSDAN